MSEGDLSLRIDILSQLLNEQIKKVKELEKKIKRNKKNNSIILMRKSTRPQNSPNSGSSAPIVPNMIISEFLVNQHRFTFYEKENVIEIEEFVNNDFKTRVILPKNDFEELIRLYKEWREKL